jgi:uncharacterized protein
MPADPADLEARLQAAIRPRARLLTAFSGGIDSTLVATAARRFLGRENAPAALGDSPSLPRRELLDAQRIAEQLDIELLIVQPDEQADPRYQANAPDRCYFCKTHLYHTLQVLAARLAVPWIANGTNADDPADHRPGLRAADEARIVSPLLEARLTKADVRTLAAHWNLPNAHKPAAACLASRIPHGSAVTDARLRSVELAEDALLDLGFSGLRVRHHDAIARIELPIDQLHRALSEPARSQILSRLTALGFTYITLDLAGFRSGSGNLVHLTHPTHQL